MGDLRKLVEDIRIKHLNCYGGVYSNQGCQKIDFPNRVYIGYFMKKDGYSGKTATCTKYRW